MIGILLAILAALVQSIGDIGKKRISQIYHPFLVNWIPISIGLILNFTYLFIVGFPEVNWPDFLSCLLLAVILLVIIEIRFVKALTSGDLSLVMPFGSFIPVINSLYAWVLLGEEPTFIACIGVLIIVAGSWVMFADLSRSGGLLAPFRAILSEPGPRHMLILALWNGLFTLIMKIGSSHSSAIFFFTMVILGEFIFFSFMLWKNKLNPLTPFRENPGICLQAGLFWTLGLSLFFVSLSMTLVAYASAANRTHVLFVVILSHFLLREGDIRKRLLGCILMLLGIALILVPVG